MNKLRELEEQIKDQNEIIEHLMKEISVRDRIINHARALICDWESVVNNLLLKLDLSDIKYGHDMVGQAVISFLCGVLVSIATMIITVAL